MVTRFHIEPFDENNETWTSYLERLEISFTFSDTTEEKKRITLLHVIGQKTYGFLRDLLQPTLPQHTTYEQIVSTLNGHFSPPPNEVAEAFKFHRRYQHEGEDAQLNFT